MKTTKTQRSINSSRLRRAGTRADTLVNGHFDLALALGITIATVALVFVPYLNGTFLRPVLGIVFVLLVPGYVFIAAFFPRKEDMSDIERIALSFGFSIGVLGLIGIGLNYTPWLIRLEPLMACATGFVVVCVYVSIVRRAAVPQDERFSVRVHDVADSARRIVPQQSTRFDKALTAVILISIVVSTATFAYLVLAPTGDTFTELYIMGPSGAAVDYPTQYVLGQVKNVTVGVVNQEQRDTTYDLVIRLNGTSNATTLYTENFTLANGETFQKSVPLKPDRIGQNMKMEFLLYRNSDYSAPYRETYLWVNVTKS
jgi:uncharacterized membrane protein